MSDQGAPSAQKRSNQALGWGVFVAGPAIVVGILFSAMHPVLGLVVGTLTLGFLNDVAQPRPERGER